MQLNAKRSRQSAHKSLVAFVVGTVRYALEINQVREIVTPLPLTLLPHTPSGLAGVADHRSEVVPIIDLRVRFGISPSPQPSRKSKWILVELARRAVGLVVDDVIGVLRVPTGEFRPPPDLGGGEQARGIVDRGDGGRRDRGALPVRPYRRRWDGGRGGGGLSKRCAGGDNRATRRRRMLGGYGGGWYRTREHVRGRRERGR